MSKAVWIVRTRKQAGEVILISGKADFKRKLGGIKELSSNWLKGNRDMIIQFQIYTQFYKTNTSAYKDTYWSHHTNNRWLHYPPSPQWTDYLEKNQ